LPVRFNVDDIDAAALRAQAQWLQRYPQVRATIEGHCDERGTREYNLALGERRANAAKNYLVSLGVDASRITVVSYGKERPKAMGSNESAWAQNRRAATITLS
jgi:peptidoglycan-associated lipoprotein